MFLSTSRGLSEALDGFVYWVVYPQWLYTNTTKLYAIYFHSNDTE